MLLSEPTQVIENNQVPQLIYQGAQTSQIADGQIQYIIQESDDLQGDNNFSIVQPATQQVFYSEIPTENGTSQLIQHHGQPTTIAHLSNALDVQKTTQQQQFHQQHPTNQTQLQQQQIVIANYPQHQQQILLTNSGTNTTTNNANIAQVGLHARVQV